MNLIVFSKNYIVQIVHRVSSFQLYIIPQPFLIVNTPPYHLTTTAWKPDSNTGLSTRSSFDDDSCLYLNALGWIRTNGQVLQSSWAIDNPHFALPFLGSLESAKDRYPLVIAYGSCPSATVSHVRFELTLNGA